MKVIPFQELIPRIKRNLIVSTAHNNILPGFKLNERKTLLGRQFAYGYKPIAHESLKV